MLFAGLAGHKYREHGHENHHYGRDAALAGGVLEHQRHKHHNKHANDHTIGDKIKGNVEKAVGKITGDRAKIVQGDILAHGSHNHAV